MKAFATWRSELVRVFFDGTIAASTQAEVYSQLTENAHEKQTLSPFGMAPPRRAFEHLVLFSIP